MGSSRQDDLVNDFENLKLNTKDVEETGCKQERNEHNEHSPLAVSPMMLFSNFPLGKEALCSPNPGNITFITFTQPTQQIGGKEVVKITQYPFGKKR